MLMLLFVLTLPGLGLLFLSFVEGDNPSGGGKLVTCQVFEVGAPCPPVWGKEALSIHFTAYFGCS